MGESRRAKDPGFARRRAGDHQANIDQQGFATTNGLSLQRDLIAATNSPVVDICEKAGAVILRAYQLPGVFLSLVLPLTSSTVIRRNPRIGQSRGSSSVARVRRSLPVSANIAHGTDIAARFVTPLMPAASRPAAYGWPCRSYNAALPERTIGPQISAVSGPLRAPSVISGSRSRDVPLTTCAILVGAGAARRPVMPKRAALCLRPDGLETVAEVKLLSPMRASAWSAPDGRSRSRDHAAAARGRRASGQALAGDGYEAQLAAASGRRSRCAGLACAQPGQGFPIRRRRLLQGADASATLMREWLQFLETYPVLVIRFPLSCRSPTGWTSRRGLFARVWQAS